MRTVTPPRGARGFTLIEALVVVAIMGTLLAVGMPAMSNWLLGRKALAAAVFYQEGFALARTMAITHGSHSRLVLTENAANGKLDWRVDICFPNKDVVCDAANTSGWSTAGAAAPHDPDSADAAHKFLSVVRSAEAIPDDQTMQQDVVPSGASTIHFNQMGWVDGTVTPRVTRIDLAPALTRPGAFQKIAIGVPLSGIAVICDPSAVAPDVRGCPP